MERKSFISQKNGKLSKIAPSEIEGLSFATFQKALRNKDVKVNDKRVSKDKDIVVGDKVEVYYYPREKAEQTQVVFEDENILVAYKKSGMLSETFYNDLSEKTGELYFIHRLDRNTDGIMIFAKTRIAEKELLLGFKEHRFVKKYIAEVYGKMPKKEDTLTAFLVKDADNMTVYVHDEKVRGSVLIKTGYKVLKENKDTSVLEVRLYTGKTHQIRAHLSHIGHFIVGDGKYGDNAFNKSKKAKTQRLSAYKLVLFFDKKSALYYLNEKEFVYDVKGI